MGNTCSKSSAAQVRLVHVEGPVKVKPNNGQTQEAHRDIAQPVQGQVQVPVSTAAKEQAAFAAPSLLKSLQWASSQLAKVQDEQQLTAEEIQETLKIYQEIKRVLSVATRTGDMMSKATSFHPENRDFKPTFDALIREFDEAEQAQQQLQKNFPAAVRPLSVEALQEVKDFFILDNSLRETTVGAPRGHTLEEKHKIIDSIAGCGLEEIILGSFGSKISVDFQIAERWRELGKSFDSTWGFSDAYDLEPYQEDELWRSVPEFLEKEKSHPGSGGDFYTPPHNVKHKYSKADLELFQTASKGFQKGAYPITIRPKSILKQMNPNEDEFLSDS
jgi:hypothetical protein